MQQCPSRFDPPGAACRVRMNCRSVERLWSYWPLYQRVIRSSVSLLDMAGQLTYALPCPRESEGTAQERQVKDMKIIELEGTPAELTEYKLLLEQAADGQGKSAEMPKPKEPMRLTADGDLPPKLLAFVDSRLGPGVDGELVLEALRRSLAIAPEVEARVGSFKDTPDGLSSYVMLFRRGSNVGALCYLDPHNAGSSLRVPLEEARSPSVARNVQEADPYKVNVGVTSLESVEEFVRLVTKGYELAKK